MTTQVTIVLGESKQALAIPLSVLGQRLAGNRYEVQVLVKGQPEPRVITTGRKDSVHIEVLEGLTEGERLVIGDSASAEAAQQANAAERRGPPPRG